MSKDQTAGENPTTGEPPTSSHDPTTSEAPTTSDDPARWHNWSGEVSCRPTGIYRPTTEEELREVIAGRPSSVETVRVAGSGHSFSPVVPSDDVLISLSEYTGVVDVDPDNERATVRAGTPLHELTAQLADHGLAMENLGDIDRQSIAGALSTGTHGTGEAFGVLSTQVSGLRLVTADGEVLDLDPDSDPDRFRAAQVSLGALGVVSQVTLDLVPAYRLEQREHKRPLEEVLGDLNRYRSDHRNFEFFTFPYTDDALVKTLDETDEPATSSSELLDESFENVAWEAMCRVGDLLPPSSKYMAKLASATISTSHEVGPAHEIFPTARDVRFNETEYGVPADRGAAALRAIRELVERRSEPVQFPVEFRYVAGDDIPISPAYGDDRVFVAVHKYHRRPYREFFDACEDVFAEFDGRPHWGKHHTLTAEDLVDLYPEWDLFQEVRGDLDPEGLFCNDHLADLFGVEG